MYGLKPFFGKQFFLGTETNKIHSDWWWMDAGRLSKKSTCILYIYVRRHYAMILEKRKYHKLHSIFADDDSGVSYREYNQHYYH